MTASSGNRIACMLGDGIGPEIVPAARRVADAALVTTNAEAVDWIDLPMGASALAERGRVIPLENYEVLEQCLGWLVGPHDSQSYPSGWRLSGEKVPGAELRTRYDLFANIRPSRTRTGVPGHGMGMDLVIVRENTEGLYADRNMHAGSGEFMPSVDVALSVGVFTRSRIARIAKCALDLAAKRRKHLTIVHKANVMPISFGLFVDECRDQAASYPDVVVDDVLVDSMAAHLLRHPQHFDVIVAENLVGDVLSDLASEVAGALGLAGSINLGDHHAMAQAAHGAAPDIAGLGIANPIGMIISVAMLLRRIGEIRGSDATARAGDVIEAAVDTVLACGTRTRDLGGTATTEEITDEIMTAIIRQGERA